jgi:2'-5' RNA ligase
MSKSLYFVAIIPPAEINTEIHAFKERIAEKYNSKSALKTAVHITLFPPLELPEDVEKNFISILDQIASRHHSFDIHLNGFGSFPPRVIFVKPEKELRMNILSREIVDNFIHHISPAMELRTFKFKAHMTIGYRDLDPSVFPAAWGEFKNKKYERSFPATEICLLKHDTKKWNILHCAKLARTKTTEIEKSLDLFS